MVKTYSMYMQDIYNIYYIYKIYIYIIYRSGLYMRWVYIGRIWGIGGGGGGADFTVYADAAFISPLD